MNGSFQLTTLTKTGGALTKRISIADDGTILSNGSECVMSNGVARRTQIKCVHDLAGLINSLKSDQALALGRIREDLPEICNVVTKNKLSNSPDLIARTSEFIGFKSDAPAFALLDYDVKGMPVAVRNNIVAAGGFFPAMQNVIRDIARVAHILRRSTSAGLFNAETGERFAGSEGQHLYVAVTDGTDIDRFLRDLHRRCFLRGFGWLMVGKGGQFLERSIVDRMVGAPERLVFEGAPVLVPPLAQDAESRRAEAADGDMLDTRRMCPALTVFEKHLLGELIDKEKQRLAPAAAKERDRFIDEKTEDLIARTSSTKASAKATILSWTKGILLPSVVLPFDDPDLAGCTVADVLNDPARFEGSTLADPLEGVEYGRCKTKVMLRIDGTPWINSFAHGRSVYELKYDRATIQKIIDKAAPDTITEMFVALVPFAQLTEIELEELRNFVVGVAKCSKRPIDRMIKNAREEHKSSREREQQKHRTRSNTDYRPSLLVPEPDAEWIPQMQALNEVISKNASKLRLRNVDAGAALHRLATVPGTHAFKNGN